MYNIILDRLPTEYNGYLIRTSFRIGMQICMCMKDDNLTDQEKLSCALSLLYGNGIPSDINDAVAGLSWFMNCGNEPKKSARVEKEVLFWDFDSVRLYSSFMQTYNIDITKEDMHWFKFVGLIGSFSKDCAMTQAISIRTFDTKDLKGKQLSEMMRLKQDLTPEIEYTDEEKRKIEEFDKLFSGGVING